MWEFRSLWYGGEYVKINGFNLFCWDTGLNDSKAFAAGLSQVLIVPATLAISMGAAAVAQSKLYNPIPLPPGNRVTDTLSEKRYSHR